MINTYNLYRIAHITIISIMLLAIGCSTPQEKVLESGVIIIDRKIGEGVEASQLDRVTIDYEGYMEDGLVFDRSTKPGREPLRFTIGAEEVISGLEIGVAGMKKGGKRRIIIPARLGYGIEGAGDRIPKNADLTFEVELLSIERFD